MLRFKVFIAATLVVVSAAFMPAPASAQETPPVATPTPEEPRTAGAFSGNVALTSEYYFRGISQTGDAPAIQGGFDYEVGLGKPVALYLGVWGSNVEFNEVGIDGQELLSVSRQPTMPGASGLLVGLRSSAGVAGRHSLCVLAIVPAEENGVVKQVIDLVERVAVSPAGRERPRLLVGAKRGF